MNAARKPSSNRSSQEKEAAPLSLDYDHLWRLCAKNWIWLVGAVVAGIIGGYIYAIIQIPIYSAQATILVQGRDSTLPTVGPDEVSGDMIRTFEQLLETKDMSQSVVQSEHLNENPDFLPEGVTPPVSEETATGMLAGSVTIRIRPLTRLIDISVEHRSPKMAQFLANRMADASIKQESQRQTGSAGGLSDDLEKEVSRLQQKVKESEQALQQYETTHNMSGTLDSPVNPTEARLTDLNQEYLAAQAQVTLLKERYGEFHPKLIQAEETVQELSNEVAKAQDAAAKSSVENIGYDTLRSDVESYRTQLDNMLKGLRQANTSANVSSSGLRVVDEATLPWAPVSPNKKKIVLVGGGIGLLCGMGFIMGLYFVDSSIRTVSQAENALGLPVIAAVPILTESDGRSILPTFSDPQSFVAESFRGLRASLILHDRENPLKTVLIVSAIPGEGKSFCAANTAVAFAQAGLKTLLIDADLRLPTLHSYFNVQGESKGFIDVLAGRATLASAVVQSQMPTLSLLLTTIAADSPAELLSGIRLPLLLDEAAQHYDRIVIDSAPLNAVSDTMLIMQKADAILLVIRAAQTPVSECKAALQKISTSKMKPMGLILNYLAAHTLKSYSYGYSYGQKPK